MGTHYDSTYGILPNVPKYAKRRGVSFGNLCVDQAIGLKYIPDLAELLFDELVVLCFIDGQIGRPIGIIGVGMTNVQQRN